MTEVSLFAAVIWTVAFSFAVGGIYRNTKATKENTRKQLEFLDYIAGLLEDEFGKGKKKSLSNDHGKSSN